MMPTRVLQIEDDIQDSALYEKMLLGEFADQYQLTQVGSLQEALSCLNSNAFDVILSDLCLPDSYGFETLKNLLQYVDGKPIVVLTSDAEEDIAMKAIQHGAQDYLVKGQVNKVLLQRSIRYAIDRKQAEVDLTYLAQYDRLTNLINRRIFEDRLNQAVTRAQRRKDMFAILFIDLDRFKTINDNYGHNVGDQLLRSVAERLKSCVRKEDTVARLGGDEFAIIIECVKSKKSIAILAENILKEIRKTYELNEKFLHISASIGIAMQNGKKSVASSELLKYSDFAMYASKNQGRDEYTFFNLAMAEEAKLALQLENELRNAIERSEFFLEFQPKVDIYYNTVIGAEALLRWRHPEKGVIAPNDFIPKLEETGYIVPVGKWVLETACRQWKKWLNEGKVGEKSKISVNISARQLTQGGIQEMLGDVLRESGLSPDQLDLELTESTLLEINNTNTATLKKLKSHGVSLSIDDFGTGYASISCLKNFPIDCLNVDRSFIKDILFEEKDAAIAASILEFAKNLNLQIVVEGVDHIDKVQLLSSYGYRTFQGFYFSRPLPGDLFIELFGNQSVH